MSVFPFTLLIGKHIYIFYIIIVLARQIFKTKLLLLPFSLLDTDTNILCIDVGEVYLFVVCFWFSFV